MKSSNPVFARSDEFNGLDSVVEKTAITLGLVVLGAAVSWFLIGDISNPSALATAWALSMGGSIIGFALAMVNSFKKLISPALVMTYALVEGVFVGAFSKIVATWVGDAGIVFQAVIGRTLFL